MKEQRILILKSVVLKICSKTTFFVFLLHPREWLQSTVISMSVCGSVCLSVCLSVHEDISGTTRAIFTYFLCMLPMSVARSFSGTFTIGRITYRREGVFFPIENTLLAGKGGMGVHSTGKAYAIYNCLV